MQEDPFPVSEFTPEQRAQWHADVAALQDQIRALEVERDAQANVPGAYAPGSDFVQGLNAKIAVLQRRLNEQPPLITSESTNINAIRDSLHLLKIGEDAVINTETFTLKGGAMANVRASAKRAEKEGMHVVFYTGQISDAEQLNRVEHISQTWLASKGGSEMGFSMGAFGELLDEDTLVAVAQDAGRVWAFITLVPLPARGGWPGSGARRSTRTSLALSIAMTPSSRVLRNTSRPVREIWPPSSPARGANVNVFLATCAVTPSLVPGPLCQARDRHGPATR